MRIALIHPSLFSPDRAQRAAAEHEAAIRRGNMYFFPFEPPLGLAGLAALARSLGHEAVMLDMPGMGLDAAGLAGALSREAPDLVGVTAMTTTLSQALSAARVSNETLPGAPVILGGVHPTVDPVSALASEHVDFVFRGEGEASLESLLAGGLKRPEEVPGLCFRRPDGTLRIADKAPLVQDLNTLPAPDYASFPAQAYVDYTTRLRGLRSISMMVSRGCPYPCSFCAVRETMGRKWRAVAPEAAAARMTALCRDLDLEGVWFKDSLFNMQRDWTEGFARALLAKGSPRRFQINTRVDRVEEPEMALLARAGLSQVDLGIESGSERTLSTLKKGITPDQARRAVSVLKRLGIAVSGFFMIGVPGETEEDLQKTRDLVEELSLDRASVSIYTPLPGSALYDGLARAGKIPPGPGFFESIHFTQAGQSFCDVPLTRLRELLDQLSR